MPSILILIPSFDNKNTINVIVYIGFDVYAQLQIKEREECQMVYLEEDNVPIRDGNGAGRTRVSLSHTHPRKKKLSSSPYPNLTGIKLFTHPHPHRVTRYNLIPIPIPIFLLLQY